MGDLTPFKKAVRWQREALIKELAKGAASPFEISVLRLLLAMMEEMLRSSPALVEAFKLQEKPGQPAELLWQRHLLVLVERKLVPQIRDPHGFERKVKEYDSLADELRRNVRKASESLSLVSREVLIARHNPVTKQVVDDIAAELLRYRDRHNHDEDFLNKSAKAGLADLLLEERKDLNICLRAALDLGGDITAIKLPEKERPTWVETIEFAIGVIPIVGNVVAAYEAYSGRDLFGYRLSDVERGILAGSVLLPIAGRLVKGGRALYTANRMSKMYGGDAFKWSYSLAMGERLSADVAGAARLEAAEAVVKQGKQLTKQVAEQMTATLKAIGVDAAEKATPAVISDRLKKAFAEVAKKFPVFADLDELAIERVAAKAGVFDHAKGQLMEELMENRVAAWLRDPFGRRALGLEHIKEPLEYIPGHLIRDGDGLQLTDGIIVRRLKTRLDIVAVFEAKSGRASAKGLAHRSKSRAKLSKKDVTELEGEAREALRELELRAAKTGGTVKTTLEELMRKIKLTEQGGQIRADVERLAELPVFISGVETKVYSGPKLTKWFGVTPKDVQGGALQEAIVAAGIKNVEVLGLDVTQKQLKDAIALLTAMLK